MTGLKQLAILFCIGASLPAMADIYMGTGSDPSWSPLYPTAVSPVGSNKMLSTVIPTTTESVSSMSAATISQPTPFTAPSSSSASSFSSTNYSGVPASSPIVFDPAASAIPCQQVDNVYGKGPLIPMPCPSASSVLGTRPVTYKIRTGSLKANVEHMAAQSHWGQVVWDAPNDYKWVGNITITATSIQDALNQLLEPYPLQAVFYDTNRVIDIVPRRKQ